MLVNWAMIGLNFLDEIHYPDDFLHNGTLLLFFALAISKVIYVQIKAKEFYQVFAAWNVIKHHPLFIDSEPKFRAQGVSRMRKLLVIILMISIFSVVAWSMVTRYEPPYRMRNYILTNETWYEEVGHINFLLY